MSPLRRHQNTRTASGVQGGRRSSGVQGGRPFGTEGVSAKVLTPTAQRQLNQYRGKKKRYFDLK
jgi:hypothetical protein